MKVCLSHKTAVTWLMYHANPRSGAYHARPVSLEAFKAPVGKHAQAIIDAVEAETGLCLTSVDVLVFSAERRRRDPRVHCHVCSVPLPSGAVIPVPNSMSGVELYVASPELAFLQCAQTGDIIDAVYCGFALCSDYRMTQTRTSGVVMRRPPDSRLTTRTRLGLFLEVTRPMDGSVRARRALRFVLEGSRSPMESKLALVFGLPARFGGFQLGELSLNPRLQIMCPKGDRTGSSVSVRFPDMLFEALDRKSVRRRVAVDYDADSEHAVSREKLAADSSRRNELADVDGLVHYTVTTRQAGDFGQVSALAERIRRGLGARPVPRIVGDPDSPANKKKLDQALHRRFGLWARMIGVPQAQMRARSS